MRSILIGILALYLAELAKASSEVDTMVATRFEQLGLEIRRHRAEILPLLHEERQTQLPEIQKGQEGVRVYLRWASDSNASPRELKVSLRQVDGSEVSRVLELRNDPSWRLQWYSLLFPRLKDAFLSLHIDVLYEVKGFQTPFQERRNLKRASGSLPLLNGKDRSLYVRMELESLSPLSQDRAGEAGLRLSSMNDIVWKGKTP